MRTVVLTGETSGLGRALQSELNKGGWIVRGFSFSHDLTSRSQIESFIDSIPPENPVECLINCAGVNYIDWFEKLPEEEWDRLIDINVKSIWRLTKGLINAGKFSSAPTVLNIVSNASHMPMTHSAIYNASKGAAHILTLQMARELKKTHNITVFGVSPNKMRGTEMSQYIEDRVPVLRGWTKEQAEAYQLSSLAAGEETDPETVAEFIAFLLSTKQRHKFLNGCILPYGA